MDLDTIFKILGLGAVGVAGVALLVWHNAYRSLLAYAARETQASRETISVLASQLRHYQVLVIVSLLCAAAVQLLSPVVERLVGAKHDLLFSIMPDDVMTTDLQPAISVNGHDLVPVAMLRHKFESFIDGRSNVDVNLLKLRDRLQLQQRQLSELAQWKGLLPKPGGPSPTNVEGPDAE